MSEPIVDPTTGEVLDGAGDDVCRRCDAYRRQAEVVMRDLAGAERELRNLRRRVGALEAELRERRMESPEAQTVRAIYDRWVERTGRNPRRTRLGDRRHRAVLARLREGYSAEDLMRAVDGLAWGAATSSSETQRQALLRVMQAAIERVDEGTARELRAMYAAAMRGVQVYDDLELAMRSEVQVERFRAIAERVDPGGGFRPAA